MLSWGEAGFGPPAQAGSHQSGGLRAGPLIDADSATDTIAVGAVNGSISDVLDNGAAANCSGDSTSESCQVGDGDPIEIDTSATSSSYTLSAWSGTNSTCAGNGATDSCSFTAHGSEADTVNYTQTQDTITVGAVNGSISDVLDNGAAANCSGDSTSESCQVGDGDPIEIDTSATSSSYTLSGWSGTNSTCAGNGATDSCSFTAHGSEADTVNYTQTQDTITVGAVNGSISDVLDNGSAANCSGDSTSESCQVGDGDPIVIDTSPKSSSYTLSGWSGTNSTCKSETAGTSCSFTAHGSEYDTANYTQTQDTITIQTSGSGSVTSVTDDGNTVSCPGGVCTVGDGDPIEINTSPNTDYETSWSGGSCGTTSTGTNACSFKASRSEIDSISFVQIEYTLTTVVGSNGGVNVTDVTKSQSLGSCTGGGCQVGDGDHIMISAAPSTDYQTSWSGGSCANTGTAINTCTFVASGSETDTINFPQIEYTLTTVVGSNGGVTVTNVTKSQSLGSCSGIGCQVGDGDHIMISAAPATHYQTSWSGGSCANTGTAINTCTFVASGSETDTISFVQILDTITPTVVGNGTVSVSDNGHAVGCSTSCQVGDGDPITIMATANAGNINNGNAFLDWTGTGQCKNAATTNPCSFVAAGPEADTANFIETFAVAAISAPGEGSASVTDDTPHPNSSCTNQPSCTVDAGDMVTLTAANNTGYTFAGWEGASGTTGCGSAANNPCIIGSAAANETDTATFTLDQYNIGAASANSAYGNVLATDSNTNANCTTPLPAAGLPSVACNAYYGDTVTLTAVPAPGYVFAGWSGTGISCPTVTVNPNRTCVLTDVAKSEMDTANFAPSQFTITATANANGTVSIADADPNTNCGASGTFVTCTAYYDDAITISAAPNPDVVPNEPSTGYHFTGWSGNGTCTGKDPQCTFAASGPETDTASFANPAEFVVTASVGADGAAGTVTVSDTQDSFAYCATTGTYCYAYPNDTVTLTAAPNPGYSFVDWSGGSCAAGINPCIIDPTGTMPLSANETDTASFALTVPGNGSSAVYVSPSGSDANPGTQAQPVATPQRGLAIIQSSGGALNQLRLAQGSYPGPLNLTSADDGVGIYGGFDPSSWLPTLSPTTPTSISGSPEAVIANGATNVTIQQLNLNGQASSAPSSSAYGIVALGGSQLTLNDVAVHAGNGTSGAAGTSGTAGAKGGTGGTGGAGETPAQVVAACLASPAHCAPVDPAGGLSGSGAGGADHGGSGGSGGSAAKTVAGKGSYSGGAGSAPDGAAASAGGAAGASSTSGDGHSGTNGTDGANGASGANGAAGAATSPAGPAWTPGNGASGTSGAAGAGGGGGGGGGGDAQLEPGGLVYGSGNGGGGGGGGGSGGSGGSGGGGGGGSFGLYLDGSSAVVAQYGSSIVAANGGGGGNGGAGGAGGAGGSGGAGGTNGIPREGAGGYGGGGGVGGGGGAGGGGGGGPSYAFYLADPGSSVHSSASNFTSGMGGNGGFSGAGGSAPLRAPDGPSGACSGACPSLPIVVPALALLNGRQITTELQCHAACHGSASLRFMPAASKSTGALISQLAFTLKKTSVSTVHMTLSSSAFSALAHSKSLAVQLTVVVTVGHARSSTLVSTLELTRTLPTPQHKAKSTRDSAASRA